MKKITKIILAVCLIIGIIIFFLIKEKILFSPVKEKIYLNDIYYETNELKEINKNDLNKLIKEKDTFLLLIYQPFCISSSAFEEVINQFQSKNQITIYKMSFSETEKKLVKHYPSLLIYNKGKKVAYLDAEKDDHIEYYKTEIGFKKWLTKYVILKDEISNPEKSSSKEEIDNTPLILKNITREPNKVNIYFFWGNGCKFCSEQFKFLKSIENEYGSKYKLYTFEIWNDKENLDIYKRFSKAMGNEKKLVPYTIIGNKSIMGFNDDKKELIIEYIETQYQNAYDVYFDKIVDEK